MGHSYAEATGVIWSTQDLAGYERIVAEFGDSFAGGHRQTEAFARGGENSSGDDSTYGPSKLVKRYAEDLACRGIGTKQKDIVIFGDNVIVRGRGGQVDTSDSGVGIGSYGVSKPIRPCRSRQYGKTANSIHGLRDELDSALGMCFDFESARDSAGQDEASDSGVGGGSSDGMPRPEGPQPPGPQCDIRAGPLSRSAPKHRYKTQFTAGFGREDEAFDTGEGGSTSSGIGDPDIQIETYDSGQGGDTSGGGDKGRRYSARTTLFSRKVGGCSGRPLALKVPKPTKRDGNIDFERETRNILKIIEHGHYDADAELSDEYDGNDGR
jgi:hypothetical protein